MRTVNDFADVTFQKREPHRWRVLWKDHAGFISCGLVLASTVQFAYTAKHRAFDLPSHTFWLLALGLCARSGFSGSSLAISRRGGSRIAGGLSRGLRFRFPAMAAMTLRFATALVAARRPPWPPGLDHLGLGGRGRSFSRCG